MMPNAPNPLGGTVDFNSKASLLRDFAIHKEKFMTIHLLRQIDFRLIKHLPRLVLLFGFSILHCIPIAVAQVAERPVVPPRTGNDSNFVERAEIQVLEPDGTIASNAKYAAGGESSSFEMSVLLGSNHPTIDGGLLPLKFKPDKEFVAVWNNRGFCQLAISQLSTMKSIQLQEWARLSITLMADGKPDEGMNFIITNDMTSDRQFRGMRFVDRGIADRNGMVNIPVVTPGKINIRTNFRRVSNGLMTSDAWDRSKTVQVKPGSAVKVAIGGSGLKVKGSIAFPEKFENGDFSELRGEIECIQAHETIGISIEVDGTFECDEVPFGDCEIRVLSSRSFSPIRAQPVFYVSKMFECKANQSGMFTVGTLELEERDRTEPAQVEGGGATALVDDDFHSNMQVAVVASKKAFLTHKKGETTMRAEVAARKSETTNYVLLDNKGDLIRDLEGIQVPRGWGSTCKFSAFDLQRNRLYLMSEYDKKSRLRTLHVLDLSGRRFRSRELPVDSCGIAVDSNTGNLWVLCVKWIGNSHVQVFDTSGSFLNSYPIDAFTLCYSRFDNAFWFVGSKMVSRVNAATGEVTYSHALPSGIWTLTNVIPDPAGGVLTIESLHSDKPKSGNRLLHFDSECRLKETIELGTLRVESAVFLRDEIWICGRSFDAKGSEGEVISYVTMSFDRTLKKQTERKLDFVGLAAIENGRSVWAISETDLQRHSLDIDNQIRMVTSTPFPFGGPISSSGN